MSTHVSKKVVPSSPTPTMAVHPAGSGTEVPGPVPDTPVGASPPRGVPVPTAVEVGTAARAFLAVLGPASTDFGRSLYEVPAGAPAGGPKVSSRRVSAIPLIAVVLRAWPQIAPDVNPDDLVTGTVTSADLQRVAAGLTHLLSQVEETDRVLTAQNWHGANTAYAAARHLARTNPTMATDIVPVRAALANGKRISTAATRADAASRNAATMQARAARAQQRAQAATQAHARTVQAHASAHPARGTSPVPLANPQGPAASADVAPQGPAPGR